MPADAKRKAARAQRYGRTVDHTVGATSNETQPESDQVAAGLQQLDTSESSEDDNSEEAPSDNEGGPAQTTIGTSTHSNSKSREPPRRYICFVGKDVSGSVAAALLLSLSLSDIPSHAHTTFRQPPLFSHRSHPQAALQVCEADCGATADGQGHGPQPRLRVSRVRLAGRDAGLSAPLSPFAFSG